MHSHIHNVDTRKYPHFYSIVKLKAGRRSSQGFSFYFNVNLMKRQRIILEAPSTVKRKTPLSSPLEEISYDIFHLIINTTVQMLYNITEEHLTGSFFCNMAKMFTNIQVMIVQVIMTEVIYISLRTWLPATSFPNQYAKIFWKFFIVVGILIVYKAAWVHYFEKSANKPQRRDATCRSPFLEKINHRARLWWSRTS